VLGIGNSAWADEYRPMNTSTLTVRRRCCRPKRLGPPARIIAPLPIEARADTKRVTTERIVTPQQGARRRQPRGRKATGGRTAQAGASDGNPSTPYAWQPTRTSSQKVQSIPALQIGGICNWKRLVIGLACNSFGVAAL